MFNSTQCCETWPYGELSSHEACEDNSLYHTNNSYCNLYWQNTLCTFMRQQLIAIHKFRKKLDNLLIFLLMRQIVVF